MIDIITEYFIYFIIYAFIGWLIEVVGKIIELKKFVNRGFLIGPLLPIYGWGVLAIILLIGNSKGDILSVFLKSIFICSILEYMTSLVMEKLFKARWWDYSRRRFNINGRICLETMIPFGLLGTFVVCILQPLVTKFVHLFNKKILLVIAIIIFVLFIIDNIISFVIMFKIKTQINDTQKDNTEYVREKVFDWIASNSYFIRRIKDAFPNFEIRTSIKYVEDKMVETVLTINDEYNKSKKQLEDSYNEVKKITKDKSDQINEFVDKKINEITKK